MSKTPIMILQELGVKESIMPQYDVIYSQTGTHANTFTFRVKYKDLYAEATASNKKQAKQNAAQNMLRLLQETESISSKGLKMLELTDGHETIQKLPSSSFTSIPLNITNYVGILQEVCSQNRCVKPVYGIIETEGPAHNTKFKMSCTLGSITEEAIANTKKQAKQLVARKILQKLPNVKTVPNISQNQVNDNSGSQVEAHEFTLKDLNIHMADLKIIDAPPVKDIKLKYLTAVAKDNLIPLVDSNNQICITDFHLYFKSKIFNNICNNREKEFDILCNTFKAYVKEHRIQETNYKINLAVSAEILKYIKERFNLSIKKLSFSSKNNTTIVGFRVNLLIPFVQCGMSYDPVYAEQEALIKTIEAIMLYLK